MLVSEIAAICKNLRKTKQNKTQYENDATQKNLIIVWNSDLDSKYGSATN